MPSTNFRAAKILWIGIAIITLAIAVWPVEQGLSRAAFVAGSAVTWLCGLIFSWQRKTVRFPLIGIACLAIILVCLPGRDPDRDKLRADYIKCLRWYRGVRYVWGGEGFLGIDCSGLPRKAFIWAQLLNGVRTLNGAPIRHAIEIWMHDSSALALMQGYRGWTSELARVKAISGADHTQLKPGDLAVTAGGAHTLVYLGDMTWIEADPTLMKVVELTLGAENNWLRMPVVFVRWAWL